MVKRGLINAAAAVFLCAAAAVVVSPAVIIITLSLRGGTEVYADFLIWEPEYLHALTNSMLIAFSASAGAVATSVAAAYVFAKIKFRGGGFLFYLYIIVMMMPFQVTLLPQYMVSGALGIYDTPLALILPGVFAPFSVFLMTQIIKCLPDDILEAARLETSSTFVIITRIIVPAVRPGIICVWALTFTEQWNAVAEPLVLMESRDKLPLAVILNGVTPGDGLALAAASVFLLIPFLIFTLFEAEITEGLGEYRLK